MPMKIMQFEKSINALLKAFIAGRSLHHEKRPESNVDLYSEDAVYKRYFENILAKKIYHSHLSEYYMNCIFCSHLKKTTCHEYCFSCAKKSYSECSILLPGVFSFKDSYFDAAGNDITPWFYKTPCTDFERLDTGKYFRNFRSVSSAVTIANYEAVEALLSGISRGQRPCHVCAAVSMEIYNQCSLKGNTADKSPCAHINEKLSNIYNTAYGIIKYGPG